MNEETAKPSIATNFNRQRDGLIGFFKNLRQQNDLGQPIRDIADRAQLLLAALSHAQYRLETRTPYFVQHVPDTPSAQALKLFSPHKLQPLLFPHLQNKVKDEGITSLNRALYEVLDLVKVGPDFYDPTGRTLTENFGVDPFIDYQRAAKRFFACAQVYLNHLNGPPKSSFNSEIEFAEWCNSFEDFREKEQTIMAKLDDCYGAESLPEAVGTPVK